MDASKNTHLESHRPHRWATVPGALCFLAMLFSLTATGAGAAAPPAPAPSPVSEVAATAGQVVEPVTTSAASVATPPPSTPAPPSASAPAPPPSTPTPDSSPTSVTKSVTNVVDRSLDSASGAAHISEPVRRVAATVDAVVKDSGVTSIPVVETAGHAAGAASSLTDSVVGGTRTNPAAAQPSTRSDDTQTSSASVDPPTAGSGEVGPDPHGGWVGPPSAAPRPGTDARAWSIPREEILAATGASSGLSFGVDETNRSLDAPATMIPGDDAVRTAAPAPGAPPPLPPAGTAVFSPPPGSGGFTSFLLLGLLALFALAVPRTQTRRVAAACRYRSALFVCALERPG